MPKPIHRPEYAAVRALLREYRLAAGMKQVDLSAALGKPQPYISAIETGHRRVDLVEIRDICGALGTNLPDFVQSLEKLIQAPNKKRPIKRARIT
jgi:transcriptional regulator with XRE-family HTH domain